MALFHGSVDSRPLRFGSGSDPASQLPRGMVARSPACNSNIQPDDTSSAAAISLRASL